MGRCARWPTPVVGEVDDPLVEFLNGEVPRLQRSTKMIPKGASLTSDGCDRQRHESTVTAGESRPRPDLPHQVVCRHFRVWVGDWGRFGLHHLAPHRQCPSATIVTSTHYQGPFFAAVAPTNSQRAWSVWGGR
jgi:hypothetical protein